MSYKKLALLKKKRYILSIIFDIFYVSEKENILES